MTHPPYPLDLSGQSQLHPYYNGQFEQQAARDDSQGYELNQGGPVGQPVSENSTEVVVPDTADNGRVTCQDYEQNQGGPVIQHVSEDIPEVVIPDTADNGRVTCEICQRSLLRSSYR
jgi:hypothetical protein